MTKNKQMTNFANTIDNFICTYYYNRRVIQKVKEFTYAGTVKLVFIDNRA